MIGGLHAMLGRFDQGRRCYREAGRLNIDLGRTIRDAGMTQVGAAIELLAGDARAAEAEARRGSDVLERAGETEYRSSVVAWIGRALAAQGRLEPARATAEQALELGADDDEVTNTLAHGVLTDVHARLGDAAESDRHAARVREVLEQTDEPIAHADALADLAVAAIALGRDASALRAEAQAVYEAKGSVAGVELLNRRCTTTTPTRRS